MGYALLFVVLDLRQIDTISMKGVKNALLTKNHTVKPILAIYRFDAMFDTESGLPEKVAKGMFTFCSA